MSEQKNILHDWHRERGVAMVSVLMFLVIMTIIGLVAMQSSSLQERMSGNMRDQDVSFQAAENALREGEAWIVAAPNPFPIIRWEGSGTCDPYCNTTIWQANAAEINAGVFDHPFWDTNVNIRNGSAIPGVNTPPKYLIEYLQFVSDPGGPINIGMPQFMSGLAVFRVTSRGTGETDVSRSVTQSTYARRIN